MQALRFDYTVEEITEQIQKTITLNKAFIDKVESIPIDACTFANVCHYLATNDGDMSVVTGPITFLQHVSMDEKIREASRNYEKAMKDFKAIVYQRFALYERYNYVLSDLGRELADETKKHSKEKMDELKIQYRFTQNVVHEFELNGVQLDEVKKTQIKNLINQRDEMEQKFTENIAEIDAFLIFKESELDGCPADFLDRTRIEGTKTHKITYKYPDLIGIKTRCSNAETRKKVQTMAYTRCPQNLKILADLLRVRNKIAKILGYNNHSDLQASDQIVMNSDNIRKLLESVIEKLAPHVKQYTDKLNEIKKTDPRRVASKKSVEDVLEWHDFDYYHEQNLKEKYSVDNEYVREFFPSEFVLDQVFDFYSNLFGLRFEKYTEKMWHPDVLSFKVFSSDKSSSTNEPSAEHLIGAFHLDLYPREGKYNHYAMWDLLPGYQTMDNMVEASQQVLPIATMVCNFTAPVLNSDGSVLRPSLLELNEVETLFHEFGHVIHGICGGYRNKYFGQGGTNTEVDFVEAPSQMLENWLYEYAVLKKISKHYQTGESLSDDIIQKIKASQTVGVAREWARIAGMALADQVIHASNIPDAIRFTPHAIKKQMCNVLKSSLLMQPPADYGDMLAEWGHIGDDQYSARYYSYTLTRLLASDMYSIFKKANNDAVMGRKYRELILERGGTRSGLSMVTEFLGRNPSMYAFLNDTCGISKNQLVGNMELTFKDDSFYETTF